MKKLFNLAVLLVMLMTSVMFVGCSDDDDSIDIESGKSYLTINEIPVYSDLFGDFMNGEYIGSNFADTNYGYLYAYACYFSEDERFTATSIDFNLYLSNVNFQTMQQGEQMTFHDQGNGALKSNVREIRSVTSMHTYKNYKRGEILFESFDSETNLLWLRLNNVVFNDDDGEEMRLNGLAMFEYR